MMHKTSSLNYTAAKNCNRERKIALVVLLLCFAVGGLIGSAFGCLSDLPDFLSEKSLLTCVDEFGYCAFFFSFLCFHIIAFFMGTTFAGPFLLPVLSFFRAYVLSCVSASIITEYGSGGLVMALVIIGIPAIFSVPCFLLISLDAFCSSLSFMRLRRGERVIDSGSYRASFFCLPVLAVGVLAELKLVPYLVELLLK